MTDSGFQITGQAAARGAAIFTASRDGDRVTAERFALGDGAKRRKVAALWAQDSRLQNGQPLTVEEVTAELERAEFEVREAVAAIENEGADEPAAGEAASYADSAQIVELAYNTEAAAVDFIVCDLATGETRRAGQAETAAGPIVPPAICPGIVTPGGAIPGAVLVPTDTDAAGKDEGDLRGTLAEFVNRYVELPTGAVSIAVEYVLLTWVFDRFDEVPYQAYRTADAGRGKSRALETVGAVCYRSMFCGGGSSAAAVLRLLDMFGGTVVADEFDAAHNSELASDLNRILNQGFQFGRPLIKCDGENNAPRPFRCFGPKLFALRKSLGDDATESRTLSIQMQQRTRGDIPLSLPRQRFSREALELRNMLLAWRFANRGRISIDPTLADPDLEDRYNQIGLPLLSVARTADTRRQIVEALREQQGNVAADRGDTLAGAVFEAVLALVQAGRPIRPGDVAQEANRRRAAVEGVEVDKLRQPVGAHKVGWILKGDLELPRGRDNVGTLYGLPEARAQQLCQRFGVSPETLPPLQHCHPTPELPPENALFDGANGVGGNGGNGGNPAGVPAAADEDAAEREARQGVEAAAEGETGPAEPGRLFESGRPLSAWEV